MSIKTCAIVYAIIVIACIIEAYLTTKYKDKI